MRSELRGPVSEIRPGEDEPRLLVTWLDCQSIVKRTRRAFAELVLRELGDRLGVVRASRLQPDDLFDRYFAEHPEVSSCVL